MPVSGRERGGARPEADPRVDPAHGDSGDCKGCQSWDHFGSPLHWFQEAYLESDFYLTSADGFPPPLKS